MSAPSSRSRQHLDRTFHTAAAAAAAAAVLVRNAPTVSAATADVSAGNVAWPPEGTVCTHGPCGPGNDVCTVGSPTRFVFHLSDASCDINDPNGPFYDSRHGLYHNFYQDHLAEPSPVGLKAGAGPDWGHWVSRDFLHWARLPVAIWNDKWYDNAAIFTGSTTIVNGSPIIIYPGKCKGAPNTSEAAACATGFTYDVATPADPSDPFYTNWTKPDYNPIGELEFKFVVVAHVIMFRVSFV